MKTERTVRPRAVLLASALLMGSLILGGLLFIAIRPSQALGPMEASTASNAADRLPQREVYTGTYTVTLPLVFDDWSQPRLTVAKSVTPDSLDASPTAVVTYTVTIANAGDKPGTLNAVLDLLPDGFAFQEMVAAESDVDVPPAEAGSTLRWAGPWQMAAGEQKRFVFRVQASQTPGIYVNEASAEVGAGTTSAGPAQATVTVVSDILLQENFDAGISRWTEFLNYPYRLAPGQWYWGQTNGIDGSGALSHDALRVPGKVAADALMMYLQPGTQDWVNYRVEVKQYLTGGVTAEGELEPTDGFPIGLWVRGHYQESTTNAQWVTGYYVIVKSSDDPAVHWVRLAQPQIPGDCTTACDNPDTQYAFNNVKLLCDWWQNDCGTAFPGEYQHFQWYTLTVEVRGNNIKAWLNGELAFDYTDDNQPFLSGTVGLKTHETKEAFFDDLIVTPLP